MTTDPVSEKIIYPWQRFWCGRTETLDLSDYGFLVDPTNLLALAGHPKPSTLGELSKLRALILLGEPGMGKTATLAAEANKTVTMVFRSAPTFAPFPVNRFSTSASSSTRSFRTGSRATRT